MEKDLDIPLIATNDSHYVANEDSYAHEVLLCVQTAGSMNNPNRFKFDTQEFYIKTAEEMARMLAGPSRGSVADHAVSGTLQHEAEQGGQSVSGVSGAGGDGSRQLF